MSIGVDDISLPMMSPKMRHWIFKVRDVDSRAANLIKQEMLAKGGEAAVSRWTAGFSKPTSDVLIMGTLKQYRLLVRKLRLQPFGLKAIAKELETVISNISQPKPVVWRCRQGEVVVGGRTLVMGVVNVTTDSFSDAGLYYDPQKAIVYALRLAAEGADIIDIGGESTRPGAESVAEDVEKNNVLPVIEGIRRTSDIPISIDTQKSGVAAAALAAGADIINDVSALSDSGMAAVAADNGAPLIIMHMRGTPRTMQDDTDYDDLIGEIIAYLSDKSEEAAAAGVSYGALAIDPGFGFGKTPGQNLEIIYRLAELGSLGLPIVLGTSRKSTIGAVLDLPVEDRLEGTAATIAIGISNGANIVRVHDVKAMARVARMADAVKEGIDWHG